LASEPQGQSQTVAGVTVVMAPGAQEGPWGPGKGPQGAPRSPRKGPGKEAAQKRAVKAKEGAVCVLKKEEKNNNESK
jgi:hypothetical protein